MSQTFRPPATVDQTSLLDAARGLIEEARKQLVPLGHVRFMVAHETYEQLVTSASVLAAYPVSRVDGTLRIYGIPVAPDPIVLEGVIQLRHDFVVGAKFEVTL